MYRVHFEEPNRLAEDGGTTLDVSDYDDFGSMYMLELTDGSTQSVGKQLVAEIVDADG